MNMARFIEYDDIETQNYVKAIEEGLRAADEGRIHPYDEVRKWLLSWGMDTE